MLSACGPVTQMWPEHGVDALAVNRLLRLGTGAVAQLTQGNSASGAGSIDRGARIKYSTMQNAERTMPQGR